MKKKLCIVLLLLMLVLTFTGCGKADAEDKIILKFGSTLAPSHAIHKSGEYFAQRMAELTDGRVEVWLFPSAQLGSEKPMLESMMAGGLDFAMVSVAPLTNWLPQFSITDFPYLFRNEAEADYILDGPVGQELLESLPSKGLVGYGWAENGFRQFTNNVRPIKTPDDFGGMIIRTMENQVMMDTVANWGGNPTPIGTSEIYSALQQGTVDGQENPFNQIYLQKYYEVQNYITNSNHFYGTLVFYGSKARIEKLPQDIQDAIKIAAKEACLYEREVSRQQQKEALDILVQEGEEIYYPTEEEMEKWYGTVEPIYEKYKNVVGVDLFNKTMSELEKFRSQN